MKNICSPFLFSSIEIKFSNYIPYSSTFVREISISKRKFHFFIHTTIDLNTANFDDFDDRGIEKSSLP